jgi:uncharacterized membrane protein
MSIYVLALLIGVIAGLRSMTAPAAVSWAAALGWLPLQDSWLAFMGYRYAPYIFTALALTEYAGDKLPSTPSRKMPQQFATRIVSGAFSGAAIGIAAGRPLGGAVAGGLGAVIGTLGGAETRRILAAAFRKDLPAALVEDAAAIVGAGLIVAAAA